MADALEQIRTRGVFTPQSEQADPRQEKNLAGGFAFTVSGETRVMRFLTLGTEGGTFYASQRAVTADNAPVVIDWAKNHTSRLVELAREVSVAGRAPRNGPALLALMAAMALGDTEGRRAAERAFNDVVRIGTHVYEAAKYTEQFRGWGRIARRAFARWYTTKDPEQLAYQLVKYRQREGWTHRDVLRSAHGTKGCSAEHAALFDWLCGRETDVALPKWITAYERAREIERESGSALARQAKTAAYVKLIEEYPGLPWEALPDEATSQADVMRALVDAGMPVTALMRNLPKLTRLGVIAPMSQHLRLVTERLADGELLRKGRVHPMAVLIAARTYATGKSEKGSSTWTPVPQVTAALNDAFYAAFGAVEPSGKRTMIALDISGSMGWSMAGYNLQAREVTAAMSMVVMRTEPAWGVYGFSHQLMPLQLHPRMSLEDVVRYVSNLPFGNTDCALPMLWALKTNTEVDTFQVYTDNETWAGRHGHPHEALNAYRQKTGINARLQVIATTPTEFSIADPDDEGTLDVSGFDAAVPRLLADHSRGDI